MRVKKCGVLPEATGNQTRWHAVDREESDQSIPCDNWYLTKRIICEELFSKDTMSREWFIIIEKLTYVPHFTVNESLLN